MLDFAIKRVKIVIFYVINLVYFIINNIKLFYKTNGYKKSLKHICLMSLKSTKRRQRNRI